MTGFSQIKTSFQNGRGFSSMHGFSKDKQLIFFVCLMACLWSIPGYSAYYQSTEEEADNIGAEKFTNIEGSANINDTLLQEIQESMDLLEKASAKERRGESAQEKIQNGITYLRGGNTERGLKLLLEVWNTDPGQSYLGATIGLFYVKQKQYDKALQIAEKMQAEKNSDTDVSGLKLEGYIYSHQKQFDKAKVIFNKILQIHPGMPDVSHNLANIAMREGDLEQARVLYQNVLKYHPTHLRTLMLLTSLEIEQGRTEQALELLEKTVAKHPKELPIRVMLAKLYFFSGNMNKVLSVTQPGIKLFPDRAAMYGLSGAAYLQLGQIDEAISALNTAVKLSPRSLSYRQNLALAYEAKGDFVNAISQVKSALFFDDSSKSLKILQVRLLIKSDRIKEAEVLLKSIVSSEQDDAEINALKASIALANYQPEKAIKLLKKSIEKSPSSDLTMQLAYAQISAGDYNAAQITMQDWLNKNPADVKVRNALADTLMLQKQYQAAEQEYSEVVRLSENAVNARNNLAWLLLQKNQLDLALKHANKAYEIAPENPHVQATLAAILLKQGDAEKAEKLLHAAHELLPKDFAVQYDYAQALAQTNKQQEAIAVLNNLLENEQQFESREEAEILLKKLSAN